MVKLLQNPRKRGPKPHLNPKNFNSWTKKFKWISTFQSFQKCFSTAYSALVGLEEDYPTLTVATKVTAGSTFILTLKNKPITRYLFSVSDLRSHKAVDVKYLDLAEVTRKCILMGFPLEFSTDMIERLPNVISAKGASTAY